MRSDHNYSAWFFCLRITRMNTDHENQKGISTFFLTQRKRNCYNVKMCKGRNFYLLSLLLNLVV